MAVVKAVSSNASIGRAIDYVTKEGKTREDLVSGINCTPGTVKDEMMVAKLLYGKTGGRTYKHFTQSWHKDENITPEQAHRIGVEWAGKSPLFEGFQVLVATHIDKDEIHNHFIVNSVSMEDGHKFRMHKADLQAMKDLSDEICKREGLSITQKGKTFEGADRQEATSWNKDTHQILAKHEAGEVESYLAKIGMAVFEAKEKAASREEFCQLCADAGVGVVWSDTRKNITYIDLEREMEGERLYKARDTKIEQTFHFTCDKEALEHEFNSRGKEKTATRAVGAGEQAAPADGSRTAGADAAALLDQREAGRRAAEDRRGKRKSRSGAGSPGQDDIGSYIQGVRTQIRDAEDGRQARENERGRSDRDQKRGADQGKPRSPADGRKGTRGKAKGRGSGPEL